MTKHNAIKKGRISPKYFCFATHKKSKKPNLLLVHDLQSTIFVSFLKNLWTPSFYKYSFPNLKSDDDGMP